MVSQEFKLRTGATLPTVGLGVYQARPGTTTKQTVKTALQLGYRHVDTAQTLDELWTRLAMAWFTEGKTDPRLTLIRVTPVRGHYWDTKQHKVVALLKIAVGAALGKAVDVGVQGDLRV